ncbi:MAG: arylsulfotransferase family protein [Myxococcota bacterium]
MKDVRNRRPIELALVVFLLFGCAARAAASPGDPATDEAPETIREGGLPTPAAEDRALVEQLESIGYLEGSQAAPAQQGVTIHDRARAYAGLNLVTSGHGTEALLMDMDGEVLHRWSAGFDELYPDSKVRGGHPGRPFWRRAALYPNGDLLVIFEGLGIAKLDAESRPIWTSDLRAHHDLEIMPDGSIYVLTRKLSIRPVLQGKKLFVEDFVVQLGADGQLLRSVSLFDALLDSPYAALYSPHENTARDVFHTNTLAVLRPRSGVWPPGFAPGRVLVALPMLNVTAVVDLDEERVVWAHRGDYRFHHDPELLSNGRLLIFDNKGNAGRSRVLELDPATGEIAWEYTGSPGRTLHSDTCSTAQRLPNGNTLITESDPGRALEITPEGEMVWEFVSPHRAGKDGELVATLFEVLRLPADFPTPWARNGAPAVAED